MVDGTKDVTEYLKSIENLVPGISKAKNYLEKLNEAITKNKISLQEISEKIREATSSYGEKSNAVKVLIDRQKELKGSSEKLSDAFVKLKGNIGELSKSEISNFFGKLGDSLGFSSNKGKELANTLLGPIIGGLEKNKEILGMFSKSAMKAMNPLKGSSFIESVPLLQNLNEAMGNVLQATYPARSAFTALGYSVEEANEKSSEYITTMRKSHIQLGISREKQIEFNKSVADIPGAIEPASESLKELADLQGSNVMMSDVAQIAFKGLGIEASEAGQLMKKAFLDASVPVEKLPEFLGEANIAVKDIGYSQGLAVQQMIQGASTMGIFGEKASTTAGIFKEFASTLRDSGVAANQVGKIYNDVISSIAGMSTQNRAFIGMMSGMFQGASALGGALKMELAMRGPGGLEKNLESLTSSLARFGGGQILTLEQAANNPQLEMQFVLQRQMLGKLAGITNQEQQNRVLEVLQGVQRGGVSRLEGSKEISNVMNKGRNLQEQTVSSLERIANVLQDSFAVLSRVDDKILNFNNAVLGGTQAASGNVDWSRSGIGFMGRGMSTENEVVGRRAMKASVARMQRDTRRTLSVGLRNKDESNIAGFFKRLPSGDDISPNSRLPTLKRENILKAAELPESPKSALVPAEQNISPDLLDRIRNLGSSPVLSDDFPSILSNLSSISSNLSSISSNLSTASSDFPLAFKQAFDSTSKMTLPPNKEVKRSITSPSKPPTERELKNASVAVESTPSLNNNEQLTRTEPTRNIVNPPEVTATESTITVKIESENPELQKFITKVTRDTIEKEMKRYINAERGV